MNQCSKEARAEVARFERALRKYGIAACRKAFASNEEGWGPSSILLQVDCGFNFKTVGQVDAAINAGRWAVRIGLK